MKMNTTFSLRLMATVAFGAISLSALAGPMDDARNAFNAGKYGEVDEKLGSLLEQRPVPMDALTLSFNASIKAGRPYTAERRYAEMIERGDKIPADILFKAAIISGEIGKPNIRRDRLIYFLRNEKGWNENVEMALILLCRDGGDGEHFERLMASVTPSRPYFDLGMAMLSQLRDAGRDVDYAKVAAVLFKKFPDTRSITEIVYNSWSMIDKGGIDPKFRGRFYSAAVLAPVGENKEFLSLVRQRGDAFGAQHVIEYCENNKALPPYALFKKIEGMKTSIPDPKERQAYAKRFKALLSRVSVPANASAEQKAKHVEYILSYYKTILANPDLFRSDSAPARFSKQELASLFESMAAAANRNYTKPLRDLADECVISKAWEPAKESAIIKAYPGLFNYRALIFSSNIAKKARESKNGNELKAVINDPAVRNRYDLRAQCMPVFFDIKDGAMLKVLTEEQITLRPLDFDADSIARYLLCTESLSNADKVNFLKSLLARTGYSEAWRRLVNFGSLPKSLQEDAAFIAFKESVKPEVKGSDPIMGALTEIAQMKRDGNGLLPPRAFELAKKAIQSAGNVTIPTEDNIKASQLNALWKTLSGLVSHAKDRTELINLFVDRFNKDGEFSTLWAHADQARSLMGQTNYVRIASASLKCGGRSLSDFIYLLMPAGDKTIFSPYYKTSTPAEIAAHLNHNSYSGHKVWNNDQTIAEYVTFFKTVPTETIPESKLFEAFDRLAGIAGYTNTYHAAVVAALEPVAVSVIDKRLGSANLRGRLTAILSGSGQGEKAINRLLASADKASPLERYADLQSLLNQGFNTRVRGWYAVIGHGAEYDPPKPLDFGAIVRDRLVPTIKAVPMRHAGLLADIQYEYFGSGMAGLMWRRDNKRQPEDVSAALVEFCYEFSRRAPYGLKNRGDNKPRIVPLLRYGFSRFIEKGEFESAAAVANMIGRYFSTWNDNNGDALVSVLNKAMEAEAWEPAHIVASAVGQDSSAYGKFQRVRSDCSTRMPGIYPVDESSPMYPLYVAADELERNNSERSWKLLSDNLQTFEREAAKLPADFVAWGVEQLRYARGKDDELLQKARVIAATLLAKETSLTPELAASLMLTRAECYRDQRNFEAASLEYQSIRNGAYYQGTPSARKAMFRDVDLLIEMGNVSKAEQIIELWVSQPDVDIQAQAYYFMARIAFDRKDYEETRKQLDNVFNLNYTHTEARLLHGKWKLATNSEVDDTAVLVGDITDRTLIRPGQELTISVQDRNLGVAGGGNSIPVIIVTSEGKDRELLSLYPSARDPYLFSGTISTMLGAAKASNHILEVCGSDTVSYTIDGEFLKTRGLTTPPAKQLRVVDDARLAIGAAAPLAEDGKAEEALEELIASAGTGGASEDLVHNLKPGNPIYVVVRDRDRSLTTGVDEITVSARTSSGDRLNNITLKETEGASGVFRGEIPTSLPPPHAIASDTATGHNPGDIINSKKSGVWKSAPDGQPGKWIEVDTMGSYVISNAGLRVPNPEDITAVRLTGFLAGERKVLGELPIGDYSKRLGIRYQAMRGSKRNSSALIRSDFSSSRAPKPQTLIGLAFNPVSGRDEPQNAMLSAPFMLPEGENDITFRLRAKNTKERPLQGLWLAISIDGVDVFTGQGATLNDRDIDVSVTPGPHLLEIFFSANRPSDALDILVVDKDGNAAPIPAEWIDSKVHPELEEFVKDVAVIHRFEKGFYAVFSKPTRLRSLRWEFLGYNGREITVEKLYLQDAAGKNIIPSPTDYSDAVRNEILEVAPGDGIFVSYNDDRTSNGQKRVLERNMTSSFHDAHVNFFFEEIVQTRDGNKTFLYDAYRFIPGDMLLLSVRDPDGDISPNADTIQVTLETRSGQKKTVTLKEQKNSYYNYGVKREGNGIHTGHFMGQLRTCSADSENKPNDALPISKDDVISMSYNDRENTRPGVPFVRTVSVRAAQPSKTHTYFFDTTVSKVEDTSYDAKLRLEQIRRRPGNERIEKLYKDVVHAKMIPDEVVASNEVLRMNVAAPIPVMVIDPSRARHEASKVNIDVVSQSELEDAEATGRDPDLIVVPLTLGINFPGIFSDAPSVRNKAEAGETGQFSGVIKLNLGPLDPSYEYREGEVPPLAVNGNDKIRIRVLDDKGEPESEYYMQLVSAAQFALMDSTYSADRNMAHVGERFFVMVNDPDRDSGEEINEVVVNVETTGSKIKRQVILKETLPHSGLFTGTIRPVIFGPDEVIPAVATGGVATTEAELLDDRIKVGYGDTVKFNYTDEETIPSFTPGVLTVEGRVFKGSDGDVRLFSKRFRDSDMAVLVQFRLAECLFETAKEFRRLKQADRSAEAIDEGKHILEEALRNYPTTIHLVQGEYLLANLYQELAMEEKEAKNKSKADPLFAEALSRFSAILSTWPDSEFAPKAQYHKALCLEMLGDYNRAGEEYVKMTYLYPESPLVGDASIRLATYYYQQEKKYDTAGRIYANFQKRFPTHEKADRALFMAAQCRMKQAEYLAKKAEEEKKVAPVHLINEEYKAAVEALNTLVEQYKETAAVSLRAQALYWAGDASLRAGDYQSAYLYLKRTTFEYPDTEWARRARGLLLQDDNFDRLN